jgi:hypothetical protein
MPRLVQSLVVLCVCVAAACGGAADDPNALMSAEALRALPPSMEGWQRGTPNAQVIDVPEPAAVVTVSYTRADAALDLEISDTGGTSSMIESLASMAGSEFNRTMGNGYLKGTTVAGAPAVESWNTQDRLGELTVLVNKRYIIHVGGRGLTDAAPMRALVEKIQLAALK